jgi:hypothetical protein
MKEAAMFLRCDLRWGWTCRGLLGACVGALGLAAIGALGAAEPRPAIVVWPPQVQLVGNFARCQLVVMQPQPDGEVGPRSEDLTAKASFHCADPQVACVSPSGLVLALSDGSTQITVRVNQTEVVVPVTVQQVSQPPQVSFTGQIRPILNKAGCALAACHAAQHGKGGFKLSVFGSEPDKDHLAIVREATGRRINPLEPDRSLIVLKPTMQLPHGGGRRIEKGSVEQQMLAAWVAGGARPPRKEDPEVVQLQVQPEKRVGDVGLTQQLRVEATYSDGTRADVTALARFDSLDEGVVQVTPAGHVTAVGRGQAAVMIRYEGQATISLFVIPYAAEVELADWQSHNLIDELAAAKFRELGLPPSPLCDDATFLRRVMLDTIGTLPTPEEVRDFLASSDPDKRTKLIDALLGLSDDPRRHRYDDAYAAWWSLKWSDLLRNSSAELGEQGMWAMHNWLREAFRTNRPLDEVVRELITARGSIYTCGPANYYRVHKDASMLAEATAQLFLGVRIECAKCHHHPFEKYSQDDYYGLAAFFARTGTKGSEEFGLFGREQAVIVRDSGEVRHPRTGQVVPPKLLDGPPADHPLDRRIPLAQWLTSPENPAFARSVVNRYVGYLLGRGLVEPVDDLRSTNPPTNPPLLDALARHFVEHHYDLKQLLRLILTSRLYQLDAQPTPANAGDQKFYSHFTVKRLPAEALLDAIDRATEVPTKHRNLPLGTRAIELPDAEYPDYFLNVFAKPRRVSVCECERSPDPNLAQALHTLNGDTLAAKLRDPKGRIARLLKEQKPHEQVVEELYLATLSRFPTEAELAATRELKEEAANPADFYQDLLWALLNSKEFLFVH